MLSIVIDPGRLSSRDSMLAEIDAMIGWVKSAKPSDPDLPVLVAGEPERIARAERMAKGIEVDDETWSQLVGDRRALSDFRRSLRGLASISHLGDELMMSMMMKREVHDSSVGATSRAVWISAAIIGVSGSRCGTTRPTL